MRPALKAVAFTLALRGASDADVDRGGHFRSLNSPFKLISIILNVINFSDN
jgi:hypothetical protein